MLAIILSAIIASFDYQKNQNVSSIIDLARAIQCGMAGIALVIAATYGISIYTCISWHAHTYMHAYIHDIFRSWLHAKHCLEFICYLWACL